MGGVLISAQGDFVIVLKALNKELIDEVLGLSKEFNGMLVFSKLLIDYPTDLHLARMTAAYAIEAPAPEREVIERREIVIPEPEEVPRSVREWDVMSGSLGGGKSEHGGGHGGHSVHGSVAASHKSHKSHKSKHSAHRSRSVHRSEHRSHRSSSRGSTLKGGHSRSQSPVVVIRSKSRHRSRSKAGHKEVDMVEDEEVGESNKLTLGPLAMVVPHREKRSDSKDERKIKEEIRELEEEKRRLKRERREKKHYHREEEDEEVIIERGHGGGHGRRREEDEIIIERGHGGGHRRREEDEIIIERGHGGGHRRREEDEIIVEKGHGSHGRRREEEVKIEKDRKGNMAFVK